MVVGSGASLAVTGTGTIAATSVVGPVTDAGGQVYNVKAYGAKGNGVFLYDGVISSGSYHLSDASGSYNSATDVGKAIEVDGAGVAGAPLFTTIASVTDATDVMLAASASTSVASGGTVVYGTDDTSAILTLINNVVAAGGGRILFPHGVYVLDGALSSTSSKLQNAILPLPWLPSFGNNPMVTLEMDGVVAGTGYPEGTNTVIPPTSGAVLYGMTAASGSLASILAGPNVSQNWDSLTLILRNLTFRTRNNPDLTGLQLQFVANAMLHDVTVDVNVNGLTNLVAQPTNIYVIGIILPSTNNYAQIVLENPYVTGFYTGVQVGEHAKISGGNIQQCYRAYTFGVGPHLTEFTNALVQWNPYSFYALSSTPIANQTVHGSVDIEDGATGQWYSNVAHFTGNISGKLDVYLQPQTDTLTTSGVPSNLELDVIGGSRINPQAVSIGRTGPTNNVANLDVIGTVKISQLATPVIGTLVDTGTGGTLSYNTQYCYRVAALDGLSYSTLASTETCITTANDGNNTHEITVPWGPVAGAIKGYQVYGRTTGAELLAATLNSISSTNASAVTTSWTDTGSVTPSGALPSSNTTGQLVGVNTPSSLLYFQGPASAIQGTGSSKPLCSYTLLAGTVSTNQGIRIKGSWTHTTGSSSVTYGIYLNGQAVGGASSTSTTGIRIDADVLDTGSTTGAVNGALNPNGAAPSVFLPSLTGLAWGSNQTVAIQFNVASTDYVTPNTCTVEWIH